MCAVLFSLQNNSVDSQHIFNNQTEISQYDMIWCKCLLIISAHSTIHTYTKYKQRNDCFMNWSWFA